MNLFNQNTMEKCIFDAKLSNTPSARETKWEKDLNCYSFSDWAESVSKINALFLIVTFSYKACLVVFNGTIGSFFDIVNPTTL